MASNEAKIFGSNVEIAVVIHVMGQAAAFFALEWRNTRHTMKE